MIFARRIARARREDQDTYLANLRAMPPALFVLDGHSHIMTSHTTPMPLLWPRFPMRMSRKWVERPTGGLAAAGIGAGRLGAVGKKPTMQIADIAVREADEAYDRLEAPAEGFVGLIVLPMDMDYAHHAGLSGFQVYFRVKRREIITETYRIPRSGTTVIRRTIPPARDDIDVSGLGPKAARLGLPPEVADQLAAMRAREKAKRSRPMVSVSRKVIEEPAYFALILHERKDGSIERELVWLDDNEFKMYVPYARQVRDHQLAALLHPLKILPLYHYEPRRWSEREQTFRSSIATASNKGPFVGIKMYPSLGYKPNDFDRIEGLRSLFGFCEKEKIPIMTHCSPEGMYTHERGIYFRLDAPGEASYAALKREYDKAQGGRRQFKQDWPSYWFSETYVSPSAWGEVLKAFPKLHLCLAHFGADSNGFSTWGGNQGKTQGYNDAIVPWDERIIELVKAYDNCYVDISFLFIWENAKRFRQLILRPENRALKDKIIFGTDWYMIEMDGFHPIRGRIGYKYQQFFKETKKLLDRIDPTLWTRFTCLNPLRYYRLKEIADNHADGLRETADSISKSVLRKAKFDRGAFEAGLAEQLQRLEALDPEPFEDFIGYRRSGGS